VETIKAELAIIQEAEEWLMKGMNNQGNGSQSQGQEVQGNKRHQRQEFKIKQEAHRM